MAERTVRSVRLGYKYLWDISQREKASWKTFYKSDYEFKRRQGYTSTTGEKFPAGRGDIPSGILLKKSRGGGPSPSTFNLGHK